MKRKKYESKLDLIIVFLLIMFFSCIINYVQSDMSIGATDILLYSLLQLLIVSILCMVVPYFAYIGNGNKRLPIIKGKRICKWNSISLFIITVLLTVFVGIGIVGGIGALMYYFINKWLFVDYLNVLYNGETKKNNKKESYEYKCGSCGHMFNEDLKECPKCGEKFEEEDESQSDKLIDSYDDLIKLKDLLDRDIITKEEFEKMKKKVINRK